MACEDCIKLNIPERLCIEGKPLDVPFSQDELLYRRIDVDIDEYIQGIELRKVEKIFSLQNDSYNRSSLSNPEDVLIDEFGFAYDQHGIISISLKNFSIECEIISQDQPKTFSLKAVFDPKKCNYAHCEINAFINNVKMEEKRPPKSAKIFFRRALLKEMKLIKKTEIIN